VVLTERGRHLLEQWYARELCSKPLAVIPCCVDLRRIPDRQLEKPHPAITIGYVGKLGGWYATGEMMRFIRVADDVLSGVRFHIWTQGDPELAKPYIAKERTAARTTVFCFRVGCPLLDDGVAHDATMQCEPVRQEEGFTRAYSARSANRRPPDRSAKTIQNIFRMLTIRTRICEHTPTNKKKQKKF